MKKALVVMVMLATIVIGGIYLMRNPAFDIWMHAAGNAIVEFVRENEAWALPMIFLLSLGESLAFLSLLLPATVILFGISSLMAAAGLGYDTIFWIWFSASAGGAIGYAISYWVGWYFKDNLESMWPFSTNPEMLSGSRRFFDSYGAWAVFFGHFFGPVRAFIPVVAGTLAMRQIPFQIANVTSVMIWAFGVLVLPFYGVKIFS